MLTIFGLLLGNWRLFAIGGAALAAVSWLGYEHHKIYVEGETAAIQNVEQANAQALSQATVGSDQVDVCYRGGGTWDRATGVCHHANAGQ